jgi:hypothetical protein
VKLYNKYKIEKTDGTSVDPDAVYFVLRIDTDPAARAALIAYADACMDNQFAHELRMLVAEHGGDPDEVAWREIEAELRERGLR